MLHEPTGASSLAIEINHDASPIKVPSESITILQSNCPEMDHLDSVAANAYFGSCFSHVELLVEHFNSNTLDSLLLFEERLTLYVRPRSRHRQNYLAQELSSLPSHRELAARRVNPPTIAS